MQKKKRLYGLFVGILFSLCINLMIVKAENIILTEKPTIISEEYNLYEDANSSAEKVEESILDKFIKDEVNYSEDGREEMMTPNDILGNQKVTISDFQKIIVSRLLDVVHLFQSVSKPLCIIFFILSAISVVVSIIFDTKKAKSGFLGMMLSIIAYVGIMYAPELILFFAEWLSV